jgi:UDP-N-acetylmuramoylalanine--D-glutamate ligase
LEYEGCLRRALRQSGTRLQAPPLRKGPILVLGYGREGKSTLSFLKKSGIADPIGVADKDCSLAAALEKEGLALHLGPSYLEAVNNYETVIKSPGIPYTARPGQYVTSATNIFFALTPGKTIGVTGTKGKSTTSALIAAMLKQQFKDVRLAGNIGSPMLDAMGDQLAAATDQTIFVVEVSSFQASNLVFSPDIAVILEIVAEHLDYHGSFEAYIEAKLNLARYQESPSTLIFNPAHADLRAKTAGSKAHKVYFDNEEGLVFIKEGAVWGRFECGPVAVIEKDKLPLLGPGNLQNVMAACAAAITCGLSASQIREAVLSFTPLPHRLEKVGTFKGITFINDSLATTPQAARNALLAFPGQVDTLIAGGFDRGLEFDLLGEAVTIAGVKNLILFPTTGEKIWAAVEKHCQGGLPAYFPVNSMEDAVRQAYACTTAGKFCLLSPAASSFNLFVDYKDRGDQFKRCVQAWA